MKRIFVFILFAAVFAGFTACDNEVKPAWAEGDSFIVTRYVVVGEDSIAVYGLALYTFGNKDNISASASGPDGTPYTLAPFRGSTFQYFWETAEDNFSETMPATGTYTFTIDVQTDAAEETIVGTDELTGDVLGPLYITSLAYDQENDKLTIAWNALTGANYYTLEMEDAESNIVFMSAKVTGASYSITAGSTSVFWAAGHPVTGEAYKVIVTGYMNESTPTGSYLHIQGKSIATRNAVWGETAE